MVNGARVHLVSVCHSYAKKPCAQAGLSARKAVKSFKPQLPVQPPAQEFLWGRAAGR